MQDIFYMAFKIIRSLHCHVL